MPKRVKKARPSADPNKRAHQLFEEHMRKLEDSPKWKAGDSHIASAPVVDLKPSSDQIRLVMAELGRRGGKVSGAKRMENLTAKQRKAIAKKGAAARWKKKP